MLYSLLEYIFSLSAGYNLYKIHFLLIMCRHIKNSIAAKISRIPKDNNGESILSPVIVLFRISVP